MRNLNHRAPLQQLLRHRWNVAGVLVIIILIAANIHVYAPGSVQVPADEIPRAAALNSQAGSSTYESHAPTTSRTVPPTTSPTAVPTIPPTITPLQLPSGTSSLFILVGSCVLTDLQQHSGNSSVLLILDPPSYAQCLLAAAQHDARHGGLSLVIPAVVAVVGGLVPAHRATKNRARYRGGETPILAALPLTALLGSVPADVSLSGLRFGSQAHYYLNVLSSAPCASVRRAVRIETAAEWSASGGTDTDGLCHRWHAFMHDNGFKPASRQSLDLCEAEDSKIEHHPMTASIDLSAWERSGLPDEACYRHPDAEAANLRPSAAANPQLGERLYPIDQAPLVHIYIGEDMYRPPVPAVEGVLSARSEKYEPFRKLPGVKKACVEYYIEDCVQVGDQNSLLSWGRLDQDIEEQTSWNALKCNRLLDYIPTKRTHLSDRTNLVFAASEFESTRYDVCTRDRETGSTTFVIPSLITRADDVVLRLVPDVDGYAAVVKVPWTLVIASLPLSVELVVVHVQSSRDYELADTFGKQPGWLVHSDDEFTFTFKRQTGH